MFKEITKGKILAGLVAVAISGFFWKIFFPPGGSGANILLGIFVAIFFVHYFSGYVGAWLDQEVFPGGSKERARAYRALKIFIEESANHLTSIKKSRSKRQKIGAEAIENLDNSLTEARKLLDETRLAWAQQELMLQHEQRLKSQYEQVEKASKAVFSLDRKFRFLYGMPSLIFALFCALLLREFVFEPYQIPSGSMIPSLLVGDHLFVAKYYYGLSKPFVSDPDFIVKWRDPKPGDVVVFKAPDYVGRHAGQAWIKRVIATEGQTVRIVNNMIYVDNQVYPHVGEAQKVSYKDYFGFGGLEGGMWRDQEATFNQEKIGELEHDIYTKPFSQSPNLGPYWPISAHMNLPGLECGPEHCKVKEGYLFVVGDNRANSWDSRAWGALPASRIKGKASFIWMSVDGSGQSVKLGPFNLPKFRWDRWFTGIH